MKQQKMRQNELIKSSVTSYSDSQSIVEMVQGENSLELNLQHSHYK